MTLPTTNPLNSPDDDSDMFGPPRSSPVRHHQRPRVPMISAKLRQREERKRILQLCAHKLERIKDSETNLRRSVCINNTYSRLTDEVRREKQSRYLVNFPKSETKLESHQSNSSYQTQGHSYLDSSILREESHFLSTDQLNHQQQHNPHHPLAVINGNRSINGNIKDNTTLKPTCSSSSSTPSKSLDASERSVASLSSRPSNNNQSMTTSPYPSKKKRTSSCCVDTDLETLDRELSAINASMPLIDPEITQGAEQLEKAISSRKRSRTEEENDRLVREALSQFYLPTQRLISAIDDCPLDIKRAKICNNNNSLQSNNNLQLCNSTNPLSSIGVGVGIGVGVVGGANDLDLELGLDLNQNHKEFEVIMDALRLGTGTASTTPSDSCGQAAMMSESGVFHNLVVTSLET